MTVPLTTAEISAKILESMPKEAEVVRLEFEGPKIAIYARKPEVILEQSFILADLVAQIKRRVVVRSDPEVRMPQSEAEAVIRELLSGKTAVEELIFDTALGDVYVVLRDMSSIRGLEGRLLLEVVRRTKWRPIFKQKLPLRSQTVVTIERTRLSEPRKRLAFLQALGERIFREPIRVSKDVRITYLGGVMEVGRSCFLVRTSESTVLVDCGVKPGNSMTLGSFPRLDIDELNIDNLDAVIVTHAHLDHCGLVPLLFKYGYDGPVYASEPTIPLMALLQMDYVNVVEKNGAQPPYGYSEIKEELLHAIPLKYGMVSDIAPDIKLTLYNAGHILGSSIVHLHITEGVYNIVFTGDFKYGKTLLLNPAYSDITRVETLVIESTYGGPADIMPDREAVERTFVELLNSTLKAGGKVLIPTPAAGRAQEIMIVIDNYMRSGQLMEVPVFIEGLINEASYIHMSYPTYLSKEISTSMIEGERNPFISEYFTVVTNASQRDEVVSGGPCIIIATSGMMEGGPVIDYFSRLADDERNALVFVSYQVPGTLGNRLLSGLRQVNVVQEGKLATINVKLKVTSVEGFSGHSDRRQLLRYVAKLRPKIRNVIVTHGEPAKINALAHSISRMLKLNTITPNVLETTTLVSE